MSENAISVPDRSTATRVVVPQHVVHRSFPSETVILNLRTGKYHGLNPTAGEMLVALERSGSIGAASAAVARAHRLPVEKVEADVRQLCTVLLERDLIELADAA
jgi:hypothetical protein